MRESPLAQKVYETRNEFRGGLNTSFSENALQINEFRQTINTRLSNRFGGFEKRLGSRRLHQTALAGSAGIINLTQWDSPGGRQIVAVSGDGNFYHKTTEFGAFTQIIPPLFFSTSLDQPAMFATFRAATASAPLVLYIADGGIATRKWDGTTLSRIDGTNNVPIASHLSAYHTRMFYLTGTQPKHLFWSRVGDAEYATTGTNTDGGSAMIDVLGGDEIMALEVIGSSLLAGTQDSIVRFSGHSNDDISISQDTEGISTVIGPVGRKALHRLEEFAAMITDRGFALVNESEAKLISQKIRLDFDALVKTNLRRFVIGYHRGRREVWFAVSGPNDSGLMKTVYIYSLDLDAFYGPFTYSFGITSFARYEDFSGRENLIAGCADGFVRQMDVGQLDDVLWDGSGGTAITMTAEPVIHLYGKPDMQKSALRILLDAELPVSSALTIGHSFDGAGLVNEPVTGLGTGVLNYRVDLTNSTGKRQRIVFTDASSQSVFISGYTAIAYDLQRP